MRTLNNFETEFSLVYLSSVPYISFSLFLYFIPSQCGFIPFICPSLLFTYSSFNISVGISFPQSPISLSNSNYTSFFISVPFICPLHLFTYSSFYLSVGIPFPQSPISLSISNYTSFFIIVGVPFICPLHLFTYSSFYLSVGIPFPQSPISLSISNYTSFFIIVGVPFICPLHLFTYSVGVGIPFPRSPTSLSISNYISFYLSEGVPFLGPLHLFLSLCIVHSISVSVYLSYVPYIFLSLYLCFILFQCGYFNPFFPSFTYLGTTHLYEFPVAFY